MRPESLQVLWRQKKQLLLVKGQLKEGILSPSLLGGPPQRNTAKQPWAGPFVTLSALAFQGIVLFRRLLLKVLKLSAQGLPQSWISLEEAVLHYAAQEVRWEIGREVAVFHGGHNALTGVQSRIAISSIIGTRGVPRNNPFAMTPSLTNSKLFARDRKLCAYCGQPHPETDLTREHIVPFAQNGRDHWMNVVTACKGCNHRKGSRTPEQAHMPLLYAPYVPSLWEDFILCNRRILADQMEFLMAHVPRSSRLLA